MSNLAKYGAWGADKAKEEKKALETGDSSLPPIVKLQSGKNTLRFLPPAAGQNTPFVKTFQHFIRDGERFVSFNCPKRMNKGKCPACEVGNKFYKSRSKADKDRAKQFWPKQRIWANVIDMNDPEEGVQAFPFGKMIYEDLLTIREDIGDFTHPEDGFNVLINRAGSGIKTKYTVQPDRGDSPLEGDEWLEELHDLDAFFGQVPSFDEASGKLDELDETEEAGDEDDDDSSADDDLYEDAEVVE